MSAFPVQHINLLQRPKPPRGVLMSVLALAALTVAGLVSYGVGLQGDLKRLRTQSDQMTRQLAQLRDTLVQVKRQEAVATQVESLESTLGALRPQAEAARQLIGSARMPLGGRADGDMLQFVETLSRVGESGLWLTELDVGDGGQRLMLKGQSLQADVVLHYAQRVNSVLEPYSLHLDVLEMKPAQPGSEAPQKAPSSSKVSFVLN